MTIGKKVDSKRVSKPMLGGQGRPLKYREWFELKAGEFVFTYPASDHKTIRASVHGYKKRYGLKIRCWLDPDSDRSVVGAV